MTRKLLLLSVLAAGAGLAACVDNVPPPGPPPGAHIRWCLNHHPGYNPNTNLFPGADGRPHVCRFRGPYGPPPPPGY
jgi:hypothetical protein